MSQQPQDSLFFSKLSLWNDTRNRLVNWQSLNRKTGEGKQIIQATLVLLNCHAILCTQVNQENSISYGDNLLFPK